MLPYDPEPDHPRFRTFRHPPSCRFLHITSRNNSAVLETLWKQQLHDGWFRKGTGAPDLIGLKVIGLDRSGWVEGSQMVQKIDKPRLQCPVEGIPSIRVTSSAVFKFVRVHRNFWMVLLGLFDKILIFWRKHVDIAIIFCIFFHLSHFRLKITFVWVFHMSKFLTNLGFKKPHNRFKISLIIDFWHTPIPCFLCPFKIWENSSKNFSIVLLLQVPTDPCRSYTPLNWQNWRTFQSFKIVKDRQ